MASSDTTETSECVAWNSVRQEYFVIVQRAAAPVGIYYYEARRLDRNGVSVAAPVILPLSFVYSRPNVVHDPARDEYLLVAVNSGALGGAGIDAIRLDGAGALLSTALAIPGEFHARYPSSRPDVAYNSIGDEYLVAATMDTGTATGYRDIYARRVSGTGTPLGSTINITSGPFTNISNPALAYAPIVSGETPTGRYMLVFDWATSGWAKMLDSDGDPIATLWNCQQQTPFEATVPVDWGTETGDVRRPDVAYGVVDGVEQFFVVWEDNNNTSPIDDQVEWTGIWGCPVDANELVYCSGLTGAVPVSKICKHWNLPLTDPWLPQVDFDSSNESWLVAWRETGSSDPCNFGGDRYYHVRANYVDDYTVYPPNDNEVLSRTTGVEPGVEDPMHPVIACAGNGSALVAWDDDRNAGATQYRDIYGAVFAPEAALTDVATPAVQGADVTHGVAWGDMDGDGDHDLYVSNWFGPNRLFRNDAGTLADVSSAPTEDNGLGFGVAWGDADGDADLDLYLVNDGANALFGNTSGVFSNVTAGDLGDAGVGLGNSWCDYDRDGDLDLYLAVTGGANRLLRNDAGTFHNVATGSLADAGDTYAAVWGDYDDDRNPDLYLANAGASPNKLLRNQGDGTFADVTPAVLAHTGEARGASWADYDGDGDLDLYLANNAGANALFANLGGGSFADVASGLVADALDSHTPAWADYDNDGDLDLYLTNFNGPNRLFRNDAGSLTDIAAWPYDEPGATGGAAWADVDDDGDLDLFAVNSFWQPNRMFRNELFSANHWLQIDLVGTSSNTFGVGARIRTIEGGASRIREITAGSGFCSMNSLTAEFGFGTIVEPLPAIDTVEVLWPSGIVQHLYDVPANQRITIVESNAVDVASGSSPRRAHVFPNAPNPFNPTTKIRFDLPVPARVDLAVYDLGGRLVRRLIAGETRPAGSQSVTWDGRNERGAPVGSGIYHYRFESLDLVRVHRMSLIR
ncbi:MAG: hypothetical protein HKN20_02825 [Gemmatimonadetes bacterium]|nr:hypothetical protein [Gemmatimonadota bacterium]